MKLKSLQVKNFRCVDDSTEFGVCPVTCLVGKNEAGKTALLEALYKLNPDVEELDEFDMLLEYPRRRRKQYQQRAADEPDDALITKWLLDDEDVEAIEEAVGPGILKSRTVEIRKGYYSGRHWNVDLAQSATADKSLIAALRAKLEQLLPKFVYFSKCHIMDGRISIDHLVQSKKHGDLSGPERVFLALLDMVGTSPEKMKDIESSEELTADLEAASAPITDKICQYWSQNRSLRVTFQVHPGKPQDPPPFDEGVVFETRILNTRHNLTLNFDERSTGFVWFFSFLVWFSQVRRIYGDNLFILLDDPGIGLHARAQEDMLNYISGELEPLYQVIYTTHSPFIIAPDKINTMRTVEDVIIESDDGSNEYLGTKVGDRALSTNTDTLVPIQAALGYEITGTLFTGKQMLLVEKPSDVLYLKWFSQRLKELGRASLAPAWTVAPCGGVEKIGAFMALFGGNALRIAVLLDSTARQEKEAAQRENEILKNCCVFAAPMYAGVENGGLEELLGRQTYFALVNKCYKLPRRRRLVPTAGATSYVGVVQEAQARFATTGNEVAPFDPYVPAEYLSETGKKLVRKLPNLDQALDRFERLFVDVNACL
ncbi:MAG: AAA family ATPase [Phycisphaerales bacterium]|nr:MAG: AAA family ATPase [Phycisphaerales bacterium]